MKSPGMISIFKEHSNHSTTLRLKAMKLKDYQFEFSSVLKLINLWDTGSTKTECGQEGEIMKMSQMLLFYKVVCNIGISIIII